MPQQHVIDWYRHHGWRVTVLSDWTLMLVRETVYAQATHDPELWRAALQRRFGQRWPARNEAVLTNCGLHRLTKESELGR